jgi:hypothetical protein
MHNYLPYYYSIKGKPRDGYTYALYINGGQPPWTLIYPFKITIKFLFGINSVSPRQLFACRSQILRILAKTKLTKIHNL